MSFKDAQKIIKIIKDLGTKSVTVTGGGEPLIHPRFSDIMGAFYDAGIEIGLVTNGLFFNNSHSYLKKIVWCRISNADDRSLTGDYLRSLSNTVETFPEVDWAFSHVVSRKPNLDEIQRVIEFANVYEFTHVRLVADLLDYWNVDLEQVEKEMKDRVDDSKVIYQGRNTPLKGGDCYICYLKPIIGADCKVYTCCGVQYALKEPSKYMPPELCLGSAFDLDKIIRNSSKPFDGSICYRCYYENYNKILGTILAHTEHMNFV
jgi:MoaA/NifB/PqqE/SkfB family radical SAM enzyme